MRLLERDYTGEFRLTMHLPNDKIPEIPPYAILSHTWGDEEVLFRDLAGGTAKHKAGYAKIQFCGEQAQRDGLRYFWVDTCCIDKSDAGELQYALTSMFQWYRNAAKCYVYLAEVSTRKQDADGSLKWDLNLRDCRWFTRGWTLQELIAPAIVELFSKEGERLGDKKSLEKEIHNITGIPRRALQGSPLSDFSVAERMKWIEKRNTKYEEDKAYSLFGIFDVYIPVLYGEGGQKALKRLRDKIHEDYLCLAKLWSAEPRDPRHEKERIELANGGLLADAYRWVFDNPDFKRWRQLSESRLLWIKGDPGKGKTMLLCGIINELERPITINGGNLAYFFCQATDSRINNATSVLRGLIYVLVQRQPRLLLHLPENTYPSDDTMAWIVLSKTLLEMLEDPNSKVTYLVIDALDECLIDQQKLLSLIVQISSISVRVKLVVSSRNLVQIEEQLASVAQQSRLSLELNAESVTAAVEAFIRYKVLCLSQLKQYDSTMENFIREYLSSNANGTFLWVALVCQALADPKVLATSQMGDLEEAITAARQAVQSTPDDHPNRAGSMVKELVTQRRSSKPSTDNRKYLVIEAPTDSGYASAPYISGPSYQQDTAVFDLESDTDDSATIYSSASSVPSVERNDFITELSAELYQQLGVETLDAEARDSLSKSLPDLLKAFALKIGYKAPSQLHRDAMHFVHSHAERVAKAFEQQRLFDEETEEASLINSKSDKGMSPGEKMSFWNDRAQQPDDPSPDTENDEHLGEPKDTTDNPGKAEIYREFVRKTPAYKWLVSTLRRDAQLDFSRSDTMKRIRDAISKALRGAGKKVISKKSPSAEMHAQFEVAWTPRQLLQGLKDEEDDGEPKSIGAVITLTGTLDSAQALTCEQYLNQTWPITGQYLLQFLGQLAIRLDDDDSEIHLEMFDGSQISGSMLRPGHRTRFCVKGTADLIIEVGEQLAWLSGTLVYVSQPDTSVQENGTYLTEPAVLATDRSRLTWFSVISPSTRVEDQTEYPNGQCWRNMFRNPVLVAGFPVPRRSNTQTATGVEIPIKMMAGLTGTDRANEFNNTMFLKGFSAMLVAVKCVGDFIYWHYLFNNQGGRIPYNDFRGEPEFDVTSMPPLEHARHIVGWCSDAKYYAGAADANLDIRRSRLPPPHLGCLLEKVSISVGKVISGGASIALTRHLPLHVARQGYVPKLEWLSQKFVVFWDEEERRGWLVNGTSALLHTVRASLQQNLTGDFSELCLFDFDKMAGARIEHVAKSAISVLTNPENMRLPIYPETEEQYTEETDKADHPTELVSKNKRTHYRFHNRVTDHYNSIEKMIDYQAMIAGQNGINLKVRVKKHLEGWDIVDLISNCDMRPRVATLHAYGYGWVNFARSIQAPVMFGCGFGDLLLPTETKMDTPAGACREWKSVPKGMYYLTTAVADLETIAEQFGDMDAEPPRICDGLVWFQSDKMFGQCWKCRHLMPSGLPMVRSSSLSEMIRGKHLHPVQTLYPAGSRYFKGRGGARFDAKKFSKGAVIWGHSVNLGLGWPDIGDELETGEIEPPSAAEETHRRKRNLTVDRKDDSGIGSSLVSSLAEGTSSSSSSSRPVVDRVKGSKLPVPSSSSRLGVDKGKGLELPIRLSREDDQGQSVSGTQSSLIDERPSSMAGLTSRRDDKRYWKLRQEKRGLQSGGTGPSR